MWCVSYRSWIPDATASIGVLFCETKSKSICKWLMLDQNHSLNNTCLSWAHVCWKMLPFEFLRQWSSTPARNQHSDNLLCKVTVAVACERPRFTFICCDMDLRKIYFSVVVDLNIGWSYAAQIRSYLYIRLNKSSTSNWIKLQSICVNLRLRSRPVFIVFLRYLLRMITITTAIVVVYVSLQ